MKENITWKSIIYNLPRSVLQFAIKASMDTLPTFSNLRRWGKRTTDQCSQCHNTGTLHHNLNHCAKMLDRYLWRHNSIINYILSVLSKSEAIVDQSYKLFADIEGWNVNGSTIPQNVLQTNLKPDIVILNETTKHIILVELTVPFEMNIDSATQRKKSKYDHFIQDFKGIGFKCDLLTLCIGSRGLVTKENRGIIDYLVKTTKSITKSKEIVQTCSKIALLSSYVIFHARNEPSWRNPNYIQI